MVHHRHLVAIALRAAAVGAVAFGGTTFGGTTFGGTTFGGAAFAGPAASDVTVTPSEAPRGGPAELTFHIPDDRAGVYTTKVELLAPETTPIAEIYPMSVDGWAPTTTMRKLDQPVELIHGTTTTDVPSAVTWIRVGDPAPSPGQPVDLTVSLGPMPQTDRVAFTIVQTYSDGTVVRRADPAVTLVDGAAAGDQAGAGDHHGSGGQPTDAAPAAQPDKNGTGGSYGILGAGLLVGLAAGLGLDGWVILRAVRRTSLATAEHPAAGPE